MILPIESSTLARSTVHATNVVVVYIHACMHTPSLVQFTRSSVDISSILREYYIYIYIIHVMNETYDLVWLLSRVQILVSTSSYGSSTLVRIRITRIVELTNSIMHSYGYCYAYYTCTLVVCIHDVCICMRMNTVRAVYILCIRARRTRVCMHSGWYIYIYNII